LKKKNTLLQNIKDKVFKGGFSQIPNLIYQTKKYLRMTKDEQHFILYLLSQKNGYNLTDVQSVEQTGLSKNYIPKVKKSLVDRNWLNEGSVSLTVQFYNSLINGKKQRDFDTEYGFYKNEYPSKGINISLSGDLNTENLPYMGIYNTIYNTNYKGFSPIGGKSPEVVFKNKFKKLKENTSTKVISEIIDIFKSQYSSVFNKEYKPSKSDLELLNKCNSGKLTTVKNAFTAFIEYFDNEDFLGHLTENKIWYSEGELQSDASISYWLNPKNDWKLKQLLQFYNDVVLPELEWKGIEKKRNKELPDLRKEIAYLLEENEVSFSDIISVSSPVRRMRKYTSVDELEYNNLKIFISDFETNLSEYNKTSTV